MSDGPAKRRAGSPGSSRSRKPRKGPQRGGNRAKRAQSQASAGESAPVINTETLAPVAAPARSRRTIATAPVREPVLSREAEFAYIRSDMRRLLVTAAGLLALMLVILVVVEG